MASSGDESEVRNRVWDRLRSVARPDSRLHFDFAHMHPDFEGSDKAAERLLNDARLAGISTAFVVPDNAALSARELLLRRGVKLIVSTYCMRRGFRIVDPSGIAETDFAFASTLDGLEKFGAPVSLAQMAQAGPVDLVITGTAAVASNGVRFGRSYQYFDIEWGLLTEIGLASEKTPVAVIAHDVQVTDDRIVPMPREAVPDFIATPARLIKVADRARRPHGIDWNRIDPDELEQMPALIELQQARGLRR